MWHQLIYCQPLPHADSFCAVSHRWDFLPADLNAPQQPNGTTFDAPDNSAGKGSRQVKGARLILKQFQALLVKRFHHAVRSQKDFVAQVQRSTQRRKIKRFIRDSNKSKSPAAFCCLSGCPSCQFCPHRADLHHDRPAVRRVPQPDPVALAVRPAVHLLQVRRPRNPPQTSSRDLFYLNFTPTSSVKFLKRASSLFSNERPFDPKMKNLAECLLSRPGLGTRCMEGAPLQ